jgi:hypothetical protein
MSDVITIKKQKVPFEFRKEGMLRKLVKFKSGVRDVAIYEVIKENWSFGTGHRGYEVMVIDDEASLNHIAKMYDLEDGDIECIVRATKGDEYVQIIYCAKAKAAKAIYKELKKEMKEYKDEIKDLEGDEKKEAKEALKDMKYGKSGKVVYSGSKKGVKAA